MNVSVNVKASNNTPGYRAGEWLIISGQTGRVGEQLVPGGLEPQMRQALANIGAIVAAHGCRLEDVAKVNVYLTDIADRDRMNAVYVEFFGAHRPARTTVGVSGLGRGAAVEVEAWVYVGQAVGHGVGHAENQG